MPAEKKPRILILDDHEDEIVLKRLKRTHGRAKVSVLHPQEVELQDLLEVSLVLVDYQLDNWLERDEASSVALQPRDGLALVSVLRRQIHSQSDTPVAFAIFTGHIQKLAGPLPDEYRQHALARLNNLEWVFRKERVNVTQIVDLAAAVMKLPARWPTQPGKPIRQLANLLGIQQNDDDADLILQDVEACQPPVHELSEWSHGLVILRWLLHRILPYPCFLWTTRQLAARLRIDYDALRGQLNNSSPLSVKLNSCKYNGILSDFLGARWWRVKIERLLWHITKGNSSDIDAVRHSIKKIARTSLPASSPSDHPIVCLGSKFRPLRQFFSMDDAVRIRLDDWPPYADQAWTTIELAREHPRLRALVVGEDRHKLETAD
ncbi:MAG: hypothetical protein ACREQA_06235 [Candidatus Binatia bacterium]